MRDYSLALSYHLMSIIPQWPVSHGLIQALWLRLISDNNSLCSRFIFGNPTTVGLFFDNSVSNPYFLRDQLLIPIVYDIIPIVHRTTFDGYCPLYYYSHSWLRYIYKSCPPPASYLGPDYPPTLTPFHPMPFPPVCMMTALLSSVETPGSPRPHVHAFNTTSMSPCSHPTHIPRKPMQHTLIWYRPYVHPHTISLLFVIWSVNQCVDGCPITLHTFSCPILHSTLPPHPLHHPTHIHTPTPTPTPILTHPTHPFHVWYVVCVAPDHKFLLAATTYKTNNPLMSAQCQ